MSNASEVSDLGKAQAYNLIADFNQKRSDEKFSEAEALHRKIKTRRLKSAVHKTRYEEATKEAATKQNDWTLSYKKWDNWEDEEEFHQAEMADKEKLEKLANRRPIGGCSGDHAAERKIYEMSVKDQLDACADFRDEGNDFFKEGQLYRALDRYEMIATYAVYSFPETKEDQEMLDYLRLCGCLNKASCYLKLQQWADVHPCIYEALRIDPKSAKAHFRQAKAYRKQNKFTKAKASLKIASELAPQDFAIVRERYLLQNQIRTYNRDVSDMGKAMLNQELFGDERKKQAKKDRTGQEVLDLDLEELMDTDCTENKLLGLDGDHGGIHNQGGLTRAERFISSKNLASNTFNLEAQRKREMAREKIRKDLRKAHEERLAMKRKARKEKIARKERRAKLREDREGENESSIASVYAKWDRIADQLTSSDEDEFELENNEEVGEQ